MVGATGILRPAVASLVAAGRPVVAVARTRASLDELAGPLVTGLAADRAALPDPGGLVAGCSAALVYAPALDDPSVPAVAAAIPGTVVHVVTSAVATPRFPDEPWDPGELTSSPLENVVRLVLGWTRPGRWHTPEEVSAAALGTLDRRRDCVLGVLRPWSDRPLH